MATLPVSRIWFFTIFSTLAACAGCGGGGDGGDVVVELGTGTIDFEAISEDTPPQMEVTPGPQGGHHFFVHARIKGMDPGDPTMPGLVSNPYTRFEAFRDDGSRLDLPLPPYRLGYEQADDGFFYLVSGRILAVDDVQLPEVYGTEVKLVVSVEDASGRTGTSDRTVVAIEAAPLPGADAGP